ncbi:hypothetical protein FQR65_LT06907 [Abscondita terminalis]|nr:hypothetical protein FQR65_LT06907 [Abscondita terminalis]
MLTHDLDNDVKDNYTVITIEGLYTYTQKKFNDKDLLLQSNPLKDLMRLSKYIHFTCTFDFESPAFQKLLQYPDDFTFDLIIFDVAGPVCLYGFIHRFKHPIVVAVSPYVVSPYHSHLFTNPLYTSYTPYFGTTFTNQMTFYQRTLNLFYTYFDIVIHKFLLYPHQHKIAKNAFNSTLPLFTDMQSQFSLFVVNIDPIIDYPIPLLPNIIPVGGLHIKPPKCLPQDLESVFNNTEHGVIFFSLGTNVQSSVFTFNDVNTFLKVFSKLQETIIWKFDQDKVHNVPKNVIISKWFPQNDILGHPKTKLFITHCGGLSLQETIYHGVPVVGIPYFIDQNANMAKVLNKKIGVHIDKNNITFQNVYDAVTEVLNNPRYTSNIKTISEKFRNQINSPLDRAVFWIEHVLRFGRPEHLETPSRDMTLYQINDLDVLLLILICLFLITYVFYLILCRCISYMYNKLKIHCLIKIGNNNNK